MLNARELRTFRALLTRHDERLPIVFAALGDPKRCKIFRGLAARGRLCVSDVARAFRISMSLASQHLKTLEITKLATRQREGRSVYYRPNADDALVRAIMKSLR